MLVSMSIRNLAVIDEAQIRFEPGLNILSGETGAGKSIVLQAISLLLGSRASSDWIRLGFEEASVEGLFDVTQMPWIVRRMQDLGIATAGSDLLIRRVIHRSGKNRIFINGQLATLAMLEALCDGLVDLCSQQEHHSLLKGDTQLEILDQYGKTEERLDTFYRLFTQWRALQKELAVLKSAESERSRKTDYLQFQIRELEEARIQPHEEEELARQKHLLLSSESRLKNIQRMLQALSPEESSDDVKGVLELVQIACIESKELARSDENEGSQLVDQLEKIKLDLEETIASVHRYLNSIEFQPQHLEDVTDRLLKISELKRKYGMSSDQVSEMLTSLQKELDTFKHSEVRIPEIERLLVSIGEEVRSSAQELTKKRKKASLQMSQAVTSELQDLRMQDATFVVDLTAREPDSWTASSAADQVQFIVQTNRGESMKPLARIASGGELSRLMLAIRRVVGERGRIGVYLFDEIDSGIGGQTAFQVGKKLKSVSAFNQVICITHLPQVAAFADHHLTVEKEVKGSRTFTKVEELNREGRKKELARMLGGSGLTAVSLKNAEELLRTTEF